MNYTIIKNDVLNTYFRGGFKVIWLSNQKLKNLTVSKVTIIDFH